MKRSIHPRQKKAKFKTVHVKDSQKTVQIRDAFNILRYDVILMSEVLDPLTTKYEVSVINHFSAPDPITIVIGDTNEYDEAMKLFDDTVINYTCLVKAETKDYSDIEIFEQKIEYAKTCPRCCGTCKFGSKCIDHHPGDKIANAKMRCTNEDNIKEYGFDVDIPEHREHESHFIGEIPSPCTHKSHDGKVIEPKVSVFGLCKRYAPFDA